MIQWTDTAKLSFDEHMKKIAQSHSEPDFNIDELKQDLASHIEEAAAELKSNLITEDFVKETLNKMDLVSENKSEDPPGKTSGTASKASLFTKFTGWLREPISIFKAELPRSIWLLFMILSPIVYVLFILLVTIITASTTSMYGGIIAAIIIAITTIFLFIAEIIVIYKVFRIRFEIFIILTLILSAAAFIFEELVFDADSIFDPFSTLTVIWLVICFTTLFLSLFHKKIPAVFTIPLPAIMIAGFMICIPFTIYMMPFMAFSWILIPFLGFGLISYSPIFAGLAFILTSLRVLKHLKQELSSKLYLASKVLAIAVVIITVIYAVWFKVHWHNYDRIITRTTPGAIGQNKIYGDFPHWLKAGLFLPDTHVLDHYLTYDSSMFIYKRGDTFDPFAFTASLFTSRLPDDFSKESQLLLKLVRNNSHVNIDRLWSGNDLVSTSVDSHIQLYPEARTSYTEMTITVFNNSSSRTEEAIYTILVPEGTVASKLSLWINGVEEPGRLTLKSKAKKAYTEIVGVEKRDPAVLEWVDSRTLRLRVFPVFSQKSRTVRIGLIVPLALENDTLRYRNIKLIGPPTSEATSEIYVDILSTDSSISLKTQNISLKEIINSDNQAREYTRKGGYRENWELTVPSVPLAGSFTFDESRYVLTSVPKTKKPFNPESIVILLSKNKSKREWESIIRELYEIKSARSRIYLATSTLFYSDDLNKTLAFLKQTEIPRYHIFPFYMLEEHANPEKTLVVTANDTYSIAHTDIMGYDFYKKQEEYFSRTGRPIYVASLDEEYSDYLKGLEDFNNIELISRNRKELHAILTTGMADFADTENNAIFFTSGFAVKKETAAAPEDSPKGNDLLARLYFARHIAEELGRRKFLSDQGHDDLLAMAKYGMIVTPISSYVVLETQHDYKRFDIKKNDSKLGQTEVKKNTGISSQLGVVPEPGEWALMILCVLLVLLFYKKHLHKHLKVLRSRL